ncbi:MAG TPA: hypothetical protein VF660_10430, partial [Actinomycetota bacterium]
MTQPLVLTVGYHLRAGKVRGWRYGAYAMPEMYIDCLDRAGVTGVLLPQIEGVDPEAILRSCAGLLL